MRAKLSALKGNIERRRHLPIPEQGRWLASVLRGHANYYGVPGNQRALYAFRSEAVRLWFMALRRRSQRTTVTWVRMRRFEPGGYRFSPSHTHGQTLASTLGPKGGAQFRPSFSMG